LILHQCGAAFGIAEQHHLGRPQWHANRGRVGGMVDAGENGQISLGERGEEPLHGFRRGIAATDRDESLFHGRVSFSFGWRMDQRAW